MSMPEANWESQIGPGIREQIGCRFRADSLTKKRRH